MTLYTDRNTRNNPNKEHMLSWIKNLILQGLKQALNYRELRGEFSEAVLPLSHARISFHPLSNTHLGTPGSHLGKHEQ